MPVGELQHKQWRDDIRSNAKKAITEKGWSKEYAPHFTMLSTGLVMIAERIGEHTAHLDARDDEMHRLRARNTELFNTIDMMTEQAAKSGMTKDLANAHRKNMGLPPIA